MKKLFFFFINKSIDMKNDPNFSAPSWLNCFIQKYKLVPGYKLIVHVVLCPATHGDRAKTDNSQVTSSGSWILMSRVGDFQMNPPRPRRRASHELITYCTGKLISRRSIVLDDENLVSFEKYENFLVIIFAILMQRSSIVFSEKCWTKNYSFFLLFFF